MLPSNSLRDSHAPVQDRLDEVYFQRFMGISNGGAPENTGPTAAEEEDVEAMWTGVPAEEKPRAGYGSSQGFIQQMKQVRTIRAVSGGCSCSGDGCRVGVRCVGGACTTGYAQLWTAGAGYDVWAEGE
jgi:hypothetical protein